MTKVDSQFLFIGNSVTVDFINTEMMSRGELVELLPDNAALVQWADEAGFKLKNGLNPADLPNVLAFRQALKNIYLAKIDNRSVPNKALAMLNQQLENYVSPQILQFNKHDGTYQLVSAKSTLTIPDLLGVLANEAAKLLSSPQVDLLKHCSNSECILTFIDNSRGQKRRWCSMETCGNRAKAATHYRNTSSS
jgi:predicted RNA-binding Zn ribbon-like protein